MTAFERFALRVIVIMRKKNIDELRICASYNEKINETTTKNAKLTNEFFRRLSMRFYLEKRVKQKYSSHPYWQNA